MADSRQPCFDLTLRQHAHEVGMAQEALELHVQGMIEDGDSLPEPSSLDAVMIDPHYPQSEMKGKAALTQGFTWAFSNMEKPGFTVRHHWSDHPNALGWIHSSPMTGTPRLVVNLTSPQRAPHRRQAKGGGTD